MLKNKRGITLVTLTITILVLIILASVATYTGVETVQSAKYYNTIAELKSMKTKVDELYEDYQNGDETLKTAILNQGEDTTAKATELSTAYITATNDNINGSDLGLEEDYRYYSKEYIKNNLDLDGIDRDFFINIRARSVLLTQAIEYKNQIYYSLCQVEGEQFSVKYIPNQEENMPQGWVVADKTNRSNDWYAYKDNDGNIAKVNAPKLVDGMTPIKYVGEEDTSNSTLAELTNGSKWANAMSKDGSMWVWVPRYAYSIVNNYQTSNTESVATTNARSTKNIDIKFLVGTTNKDANGTTYATDYDPETEVVGGVTPMIVHPAFKLGDKNLTGIWVAKFEASGTKTVEVDGESVEVAVGNHTNGTTLVEPETTTPVKSVPNVISWRNITIGESQYRCMQMSNNTEVYGWKNVNSHLIRNSEWGAVSYLCYSEYGSVPMINGCGSSGTNWYDFYTGMGPLSSSSEARYEATARSGHEYNTSNGILASTTGNIYGIYDMSGGAFERVAAYLDNGNGILNTYGKSTTDSSIKYFEGGVLNSKYSSLWESHEVSEEEKNNRIRVTENGTETYITQSSLWNVSKTAETYVEARRRLTEANFNNLVNHKGIGINEMAAAFSFYTPFNYLQNGETKSIWGWFVNVSTVLSRATGTSTANEYAKSWNNDYVLIGHASTPFVIRGGYIYVGTSAGVLYSHLTNGVAHNTIGFRAVLCP